MVKSEEFGGGRPVAQLREHGRLVPPLAGDVLRAVSVGPSGEAVAVWMSSADEQMLHTHSEVGGAQSRRPVAVRVVVQTAGSARVTAIAEFDPQLFRVQPLPDGQFVAVAARGGYATVFGADGVAVRQGSVGDGVNHVLTTPSGRVWIGYFDEGIYGRDPVAHHGITRFTADLEPDWLYPFDAEVGQVHDCYSLNVDVETAWSCFYSGFPVVRIADGTVTGWRTDLGGASTLIAGGDACAVIMGYQRPWAAVGQLDDGRYERIRERWLEIPGRQDGRDKLHMFGRGAELHVFAGTNWYRGSLDDLV